MERRIALFQRKEIRKILHAGEWWFVISDVVVALTNTSNPSDYLKKLRKRDPQLFELFKGGGQIVPPLSLSFATAGGSQKLPCWNTEGVLRLVQSIPSPKAEPFKRWLARVGYERVQEIENPQLAAQRMRALYKAKGYSDTWIEKRMRGIAVRDELTSEWRKRGVRERTEFGILTAQISKATFDVTPSQHKQLKGLKRENVRDHMTDLELIFTTLGEAATLKLRGRRMRGDFATIAAPRSRVERWQGTRGAISRRNPGERS
jgi:DNA-damage-inducible protein D